MKIMNQKVIKLTEQDLHNIVKSTVKRVINENMEDEGLWNSLKSFGRQYGKRGVNAASQMGQKAASNMRNAYNNAGQRMRNTYNNVRQDVSNTWQAASRDGAMKDMQAAFQNFKNAVEKFQQNGGQVSRQLNSYLSGINNMMNQYQFN